ncbi:MAG: hypothetical protein ACTHJY_22685, partial [Rhizobiaceae bacterium]
PTLSLLIAGAAEGIPPRRFVVWHPLLRRVSALRLKCQEAVSSAGYLAKRFTGHALDSLIGRRLTQLVVWSDKSIS